MIPDIMIYIDVFDCIVEVLGLRLAAQNPRDLLLQSRSPEPPTSSLPVSPAERVFLVVACHP